MTYKYDIGDVLEFDRDKNNNVCNFKTAIVASHDTGTVIKRSRQAGSGGEPYYVLDNVPGGVYESRCRRVQTYRLVTPRIGEEIDKVFMEGYYQREYVYEMLACQGTGLISPGREPGIIDQGERAVRRNLKAWPAYSELRRETFIKDGDTWMGWWFADVP